MSRLEALVKTAQRTGVSFDVAAAYVADLRLRELPVGDAPNRWRFFAWGAVTAAIAAAAVLFLLNTRNLREVDVTEIGARVAVVSAPGTRYRVATADSNETRLVVESGELTARLFPGETEHALVLAGGGIEARAHGTVYSLTVKQGVGTVAVAEGSVVVTERGQQQTVVAGASWPGGRAKQVDERATRVLLAWLPLAPAAPEHAQPTAAVDARLDAAPSDAPSSRSKLTPHPTVEPKTSGPGADPKALWRSARLLRGQGRYEDALAQLQIIVLARDTVWSPIALLEQMRIQLSELANPNAAAILGDQFKNEYGKHALAGEAATLRCRALAQLGRPCG